MNSKSQDRLDRRFTLSLVDAAEEFVSRGQAALLESFIQSLEGDPLEFRVRIVEAGLSTATKLLLKRRSDFPFFIKIDSWDNISREASGDAVLRRKLPPSCMPSLVFVEQGGELGILCYTYITSGRVHDPVERFDIWGQGQAKHRLIRVVDNLFEVVLKKAHWQDGNSQVQRIDAPTLEYANSKRSQSILNMYLRFAASFQDLACPVGAVHGDLHTKNVIINDESQIVLFDFSAASGSAPIVEDFARFEAYLPLALVRYDQSEVSGDYSFKTFARVSDRLYRTGQLILPRSERPIPSAIHEIRSSFWRGCISKSHQMDTRAVDQVYAVYLAYYLAKFIIKRIDARGSISDPGLTLAESAFGSLVEDAS